MKLVVRVFVEVGEETEAARLADELEETVSRLGQLESRTVKQYWKIPEYFEVMLVLGGVAGRESCQQATAELGAGWNWIRETEALWNRGEGHTFAVEQARWGQVEFIG